MRIVQGEYLGDNSEKLSVIVNYTNDRNKSDKVVFRVIYNFSTERVELIVVYQAKTSTTMNETVLKFISRYDWQIDFDTEIVSYVQYRADSLGLFLQLMLEEVGGLPLPQKCSTFAS